MVLLQPSGARAIFGVLLFTSFLLILYNFSSLSPAVTNVVHAGGNSKFHRPAKGGSLKGIDPLLEPEKGPGGKLWGPGERNRTSATLLSLVRNSELDGILQSMKDLEETWNHKFNYPWTFINDVEFTKEFKEKTQAMTKAECFYRTRPRFLYPNSTSPSTHPEPESEPPPIATGATNEKIDHRLTDIQTRSPPPTGTSPPGSTPSS
jgi:mannosyltransferase